MDRRELVLPLPGADLGGTLTVPSDAKGAVIFAHGSGSSRLSPRNVFVADKLNQRGLATLLFDLLTADEDADHEMRFEIDLLSERLIGAVDWARKQEDLGSFSLGLFGASTGAAAALKAASKRPEDVFAIVSRGGRPDLAWDTLPRIICPTLLIVGGNDDVVIDLNRDALAQLPSDIEKSLEIVPGATHLFEEPGKLDRVAELAGDWFSRHLSSGIRRPS